MTTAPLAAAALVAAALTAQTHAQPAPGSRERPAFQTLRFDEDWTVLRGRPVEGLDRLKFIPLNDAADVSLSFGGQYRLRVERWDNFNFEAANDDTFVLNRLRAHADLRVGEGFRAFVELKSAFSTDRDLPGGKRTTDVDEFDVQNAFVDFTFRLDHDATLRLRPGRQELLFGRQRLVSPLDWSNTRRTFDGVSARLALPAVTLDAFLVRPVRIRKYDFNSSNTDTHFYGVYASAPVVDGHTLDIYWLGLSRDDAVYGGTTGSEHRQTFGARYGGRIGDTGFDFDTEGAVQVGRHAGRDIAAMMLTGEAGYTWRDAAWTPRVEIGIDYASGDSDPGSGDLNTFNQLFPLGHAYLGYVDAVGRQNIVALRAGASVRPMHNLSLHADLHAFWLADRGDALYNAGGGVLRAGDASASREVGQELDLLVRYMPRPRIALEAGYSYFLTGSFLSDTGADTNLRFAYASLQWTF